LITVQEFTTKNPISIIGYEAGVCWGADIEDEAKNHKRGIDCINANHGRTLEFAEVYLTIDKYSARVMRELYTHIGGAPTRLQASTRYIDYGDFAYITPPKIGAFDKAKDVYNRVMNEIKKGSKELQALGIPKEDIANLYPLGMESKMVLRTNLRNLIDMSHQRMCNRAYWEFRRMMNDIVEALDNYSPEWHELVSMNVFQPKCDVYGYCTETKSCGRKEKKKND
jgi:thymidylate synthase (FAD)